MKRKYPMTIPADSPTPNPQSPNTVLTNPIPTPFTSTTTTSSFTKKKSVAIITITIDFLQAVFLTESRVKMRLRWEINRKRERRLPYLEGADSCLDLEVFFASCYLRELGGMMRRVCLGLEDGIECSARLPLV